MSQPSEDAIPEDPLLAETHYSQYNDFESSESSLSEVCVCVCVCVCACVCSIQLTMLIVTCLQDEYEALLGCIEDALDLPNQASKYELLV